MKKLVLIIIVGIVFFQISYSQNYKFGKVSKEELQEQAYPLDSTANAAYLYKKRLTYTTLNAAGIVLVTEVQVRMKIYNKEGFDWSTVSINLYGDTKSNSEKASNIKAVTYNLVDGKVQEMKLDKKAIFYEKQNESLKVQKFTMPNVKEGSVLEWSYRIFSPYISIIDDIVLQEEIPIKKFEAKINLLEWFYFNKRQKGYYPFKVNQYSDYNSELKTNDKVVEVLEENIPALKAEPYVNNMSNYASALQLEVASLSAPEYGMFENYATSWDEIAKTILKSSSFGGELKKSKHLKEDIDKLKAILKTDQAKILGALEFVKSKIKWNGNYSQYAEKGLKKAYSEGSGNIGDINLTLVVVLRELGVNANPVLVSTRKHGVPISPTNRGFNYVIALAETENGKFLADASEKYSLVNVLPLRVLNWQGTIIRDDKTVDFINLATSIPSIKEFNLNYKITDEAVIEGITMVRYENLSAINYRNENVGLEKEALISDIEQYNDDIEILNYRVSNLTEISKPINEIYQFEKEDGVEVIGNNMYLTPMLFLSEKENPFKLEKREYPIDFGTPWEKRITTGIEIPEGYSVESLPEDIAIVLNDEIVKFIYTTKQVGNKIVVKSLIDVKEGIVPVHNYQEIRELYKIIVAKNLEKIVLNKL
ncbi:DUF3857 domain-containing protein [Lutibacter sp. A80]|uniref:DUF3857 domain-containing protein n=1 Tax=Lutibacter sp. A80 TaxID=2918453 RepID=UPI001F050F27|nr:DUF3857 domain-containing protein [Lutibacter sp. A80]UMB60129.1 DUF3857 domain-containing protein [Lutibacter sp. A80]